MGTEAVLYAILDAVVDGYSPVVAGLENDIDEIETEVFRGEPHVSRRIYELSQEVVEFQRAVHPLSGILAGLSAGFAKYEVEEELQRYLRDVADHVTHITERIDGFRSALRDILTVNATLVAQRQNEEMTLLSEASNAQNEEVKKISAWAAILFAPTLVGTVYGMNFDHMPELHWSAGLPLRPHPDGTRQHHPLHHLQTAPLDLKHGSTSGRSRRIASPSATGLYDPLPPRQGERSIAVTAVRMSRRRWASVRLTAARPRSARTRRRAGRGRRPVRRRPALPAGPTARRRIGTTRARAPTCSTAGTCKYGGA